MRFRFFWKNLFIYCLLTLLPVSVLLLAAIRVTSIEAERTTANSCRSLLFQTDAHITSLFQEVDGISLYFSHDPSVTAYLPGILKSPQMSREGLKRTETYASYLQNITNTNHTIDSIYVYYNNGYGRFLSSETGRVTVLSGFYDTGWFTSYLESPQDNWVEKRSIQRNDFSKSYDVITIFRKIRSNLSGKTAGVIAVQLNCGKLMEYLSSLPLSPRHTLAILDQEGSLLLAASPRTDTALPQTGNGLPFAGPSQNLFEELPVLEEALSDGSIKKVSLQNESYMLFASKAPRSEKWIYISLQPASEMFATTSRLIRILILSSLLTLILSILLSYLKAKKEYRKLENILNILNEPEAALTGGPAMPSRNTDPYGYISQNLLRMYLRQSILNRQMSEEKLQMQILEMQALQQQINPHFLYNTLHSIYWEAIRLSSGPNRCSETISNLSKLMEYALSDPKVPVKLQEELNILRSYLEIQKARYGDRIRIVWDIDEESVIYPVIKMILQPLAENAVYHGLRGKAGRGTLKISARLSGTSLIIKLIDNGVGIPPSSLAALQADLQQASASPPENTHIGLMNTHRRLVLAYGERSGIHIYSREGLGTVVRFCIPVIQAE